MGGKPNNLRSSRVARIKLPSNAVGSTSRGVGTYLKELPAQDLH